MNNSKGGNFLKKHLSNFTRTMLVVVLTYLFVAPSYAIIASTHETNATLVSSEKSDEFLQEERQIASIYGENSNTASSYNVQYDESTNKTTVTISDAQTRQILLDYGVSAEALGSYGLLRSYGVTKIIWYGKASHGNADLYLSKGTIQVVNSLKFMGQAYWALFKAYLGQYISAARSFISAVYSATKIATKNGKVYKMRHFWYAGSRNQ